MGVSDKDRHAYRAMTVYELCGLFCDYHEYLAYSPHGPTSETVREEYKGKLRKILEEIGTRKPEEEVS